MEVDEESLAKVMLAYEGTSGYIGVLNILVITLCVKLVLESKDPEKMMNQLEVSVKNTVRETILVDPHSGLRSEIWKAHGHAAESLLAVSYTHLTLPTIYSV